VLLKILFIYAICAFPSAYCIEVNSTDPRQHIISEMHKANFDYTKYAEIAYNAFANTKEWKNFQGASLCDYCGMSSDMREAWEAFAYGVYSGADPADAWDNYYLVMRQNRNYIGAVHEWNFDRIQREDPTTATAIINAANAVKSTI